MELEWPSRRSGAVQSQMSMPGRSQACLIVICAYNEERCLPTLLEKIRHLGIPILVVVDGSTDLTLNISRSNGALTLVNPSREGKVRALMSAVEYANLMNFSYILEIDADSVPWPHAIERLIESCVGGIGGASSYQVPYPRTDLAYKIDEILWATLAEGKSEQMKRYGTCHLGSVMHIFNVSALRSIIGSINDDEQVGIELREKGFRTVFVPSAKVFFDASSSLRHLIERRKRMYVGHFQAGGSSQAPSMDFRVLVVSLFRTLVKRPSRLEWTIPAIMLDTYARLVAWRDSRSSAGISNYKRWYTSFAKSLPAVASHQNREKGASVGLSESRTTD